MEAYLWWLVAGGLLILAEFVVPGVFICFFGVGAILTGAVTFLFPAMPPAAAVMSFTVLSLIFLFVCRRLMPGTFRGASRTDDPDIDNDGVAVAEVVVVEAVSPGVPGKAEFRGAVWTVVADRPIAVGDRARVVRRDNLTLFLN